MKLSGFLRTLLTVGSWFMLFGAAAISGNARLLRMSKIQKVNTIYPRTFEYIQLYPDLEALADRKLIACLNIEFKGGYYCIMDGPGMILMRAIGSVADVGDTVTLPFDYVEMSLR